MTDGAALMVEEPDVAVLGAGPAGVHAALAAAECGLRVTLVDEAAAAGGQIYRAPAPGFAATGPEQAAGHLLRRQLAGSRVQTLLGCRVWTVSRDPVRVAVSGAGQVRSLKPRALVVATGATERVIPFPGWTLPGVIGLAGATVLLKSQGVIPAGPVVVAGCGPLLVAVAAGIIKAGGRVACVADLAGRGDWARAMPGLMARPSLLARGVGWLNVIRRAGIPILHRHAVIAAHGTDQVEGVRVYAVDSGGRPTPGTARDLPARCITVGHGLAPRTEILALLGVQLDHHPLKGGWVPSLDRDGRTGMAGVYAAGDGAGIRGAASAALSGRLAGLAAALDLGALDGASHHRMAFRVWRKLQRADRFGAAMAGLMLPPPALADAMPADTIVCRCEDVTRAELDAAFRAGAASLNQVKTETRCGMGPCQGRICGPAAAALAALHPGVARPVRPWTVRPPLRPVPIGDLVGAFDYGEIPAFQPAH